MLPFLKHNKDASSSSPIEAISRKPDDGEEYDVLESAMEDLCHAIDAKDYKSAAAAFRAGFELLESQPHEENTNG